MVEFLSKKGIFFVDLNELLEVNAFLVQELEFGVDRVDLVVFILFNRIEKDAFLVQLVDRLYDFRSKVINIIDLEIAVENHLKYDRFV